MSSSAEKLVGEAVAVEAPVPVAATVTVDVGTAERKDLTCASAMFALLASTPVPAASPTTATKSTATAAISAATRGAKPHMRPFLLPPARAFSSGGWAWPAGPVLAKGKRGEAWSAWLPL